VPNGEAGIYTATFCKAELCESAALDTADVGRRVDVGKDLRIRFAIETSDQGVFVIVDVIGAPSFKTGESLSFKLIDPSGAKVIDWSASAKYNVSKDVGGPGCGECTVLEPPAPLPSWWRRTVPLTSVALDAGEAD
jgi:hypothetical protein